MIAIIDYGIGNVRSITNAFRKNNIEPILTNDKGTILKADGVVLGLSGGIDSSLTAYLCVRALGRDKVLG